MSSGNKKVNSMINWTKKHLKYHSDDDKKLRISFPRNVVTRISKIKRKKEVPVSPKESSSNGLARSNTLYSSKVTPSPSETRNRNYSHSFRHSPSKSSSSRSPSKESSPMKELHSSSTLSSDRSSFVSEISYSSKTTFQVKTKASDRESDGEVNCQGLPQTKITTVTRVLRSVSPNSKYPQEMNPFGEEEEEPLDGTSVISNNNCADRRTSYPIEMNPFGSDSDISERTDNNSGIAMNFKNCNSSQNNQDTSLGMSFNINDAPTPPPERRKIISPRGPYMGYATIDSSLKRNNQISASETSEIDVESSQTALHHSTSLQHITQDADFEKPEVPNKSTSSSAVNYSTPLTVTSGSKDAAITPVNTITKPSLDAEMIELRITEPEEKLTKSEAPTVNEDQTIELKTNTIQPDNAGDCSEESVEKQSNANQNGKSLEIETSNDNKEICKNNENLPEHDSMIVNGCNHESPVINCDGVQENGMPENTSTNPFDDDDDKEDIASVILSHNSTNPFDETEENSANCSIPSKYDFESPLELSPKTSTPIRNRKISAPERNGNHIDILTSSYPTPLPRRYKRLHGSTMHLPPSGMYSPRSASSTLSLNTSFDYTASTDEDQIGFNRSDGGRCSISAGSFGNFGRDGNMASLPPSCRAYSRKKRRAPLPPSHMVFAQNGKPRIEEALSQSLPPSGLTLNHRSSSTMSLKKCAPPRPPPPKLKAVT